MTPTCDRANVHGSAAALSRSPSSIECTRSWHWSRVHRAPWSALVPPPPLSSASRNRARSSSIVSAGCFRRSDATCASTLRPAAESAAAACDESAGWAPHSTVQQAAPAGTSAPTAAIAPAKSTGVEHQSRQCAASSLNSSAARVEDTNEQPARGAVVAGSASRAAEKPLEVAYRGWCHGCAGTMRFAPVSRASHASTSSAVPASVTLTASSPSAATAAAEGRTPLMAATQRPLTPASCERCIFVCSIAPGSTAATRPSACAVRTASRALSIPAT
eukprot:3938168-Prymnesium_polylepis.1